MLTIYKYELQKVAGKQYVDMHEGAEPLRAAMIAEQLCVWAYVDTSARLKAKAFRIFGTGWPIPETHGNLRFQWIDTVFDHWFVWHIFEEVKDDGS